MREKTVEKTYEITNTVKTYIAKDGKEFNDMNECMTYESELDLNRYADKYKIKFIEVPNFICNDNHVHGISFYFPQDGDKNEVIRLLSIFQNYEIVKKNSEWEIYCDRNLSNVRDSDFEIEIPFELNKGDNYVFYFCWEEYNDGYDYFWNEIVSKEKAMTRIEEEIKRFEEIFGIKESGWHYVKDGDLPKENMINVFALVKSNNGDLIPYVANYSHYSKEWHSDFDDEEVIEVIYWKEIILPKEEIK